MFSINNVRPPLLNKKLSSQLNDVTRENIKKYSSKNKEYDNDLPLIKYNKDLPEIYIIIPIISFVSFLAGFFVSKRIVL
jgi:hypothetical protein